MDNDLENKVRTCNNCQINRKNPHEAALHPWEWPSRPWDIFHIDYAGPFLRKMFLIMVNAYSNWLEVHPRMWQHREKQLEKFDQHLQSTAFLKQLLVITVVIFAVKNSKNFWRKTAFITEGLLLINQPPMDLQKGRSRRLRKG